MMLMLMLMFHSCVVLLFFFVAPVHAQSTGDWTPDWFTATRTLFSSFDVDPYDDRVMMRGGGDIVLGNNEAVFYGKPRLYINNTVAGGWENVEFTAYGNYIALGTLPIKSYAGLTLVARSNHDAYANAPCEAFGYYARIYQETGECAFQKEYYHGDVDVGDPYDTVYTATRRVPCFVGGLPLNLWVGIKFKVTTITDNSEPAGSVLLQLYLDEVGDGISWTLNHTLVDRPSEWLPSGGKTVPAECSQGNGDTVLRPGNVCFLRTDGNDDTTEVRWKDVSILNSFTEPIFYPCDGVDCSTETYGCGAPKICDEGICIADPSNEMGGDGICSPGEYATNNMCTADCCVEVTTGGPTPNNGICEGGENCETTPSDCAGVLGGKPSNRYCCYGGVTPPPNTLYATICTSSVCGAPEDCIVETGGGGPTTTTVCCGDGICTAGIEFYIDCPEDCSAPVTAPVAAPVPEPVAAPVPVGTCGLKNDMCVSNADCCAICKNNGRCS
mmetsp:Transcript_12499/g.18346  ORF Transcript_12499/g.18346 Transcript_12499/m.18346 type:complete len:498 (+) Transcript_12499:91-1584(+)